MLAKYYLKQQYQLSINDMYKFEERKKMRQSPFGCGGKADKQRKQSSLRKRRFLCRWTCFPSAKLKNIKNRRKPSQQWYHACVEVKSEKTLKPQMRTKCGPSGVTSLSLAIVSPKTRSLQAELDILWINFPSQDMQVKTYCSPNYRGESFF